MAELEKVEKLREKANVSFAEAKEALDAANGDMLDALIYLETQGKAIIPAGGGYFSSAAGAGSQDDRQHSQTGGGKKDKSNNGAETFGEMLRRFGRFLVNLVRRGNSNFLDATKGGEPMFSCPVTAVVILVVFFWVTVPLFILSLFFGFRYRFRGAALGKESINNVMDKASEVAEDVKRSFTEGEKTSDGE